MSGSLEVATGGQRRYVDDECSAPGHEIHRMLYYLIDICEETAARRPIEPFEAVGW